MSRRTHTRKSKKKCLQIHTQKRLHERFGLEYSKQQLNEMASICRAGRYVCVLERQSLTRTRAVIFYNGNYLPVVYNKSRCCIITVLTFDMLTPDQRKVLAQTIGVEESGMMEHLNRSNGSDHAPKSD